LDHTGHFVESLDVDTFSLSEVTVAVEHAAIMSGPFRMTVVRPC